MERSGKTFTIDFQVGPLREANGQITALVASAVDVTSRVLALAALQASRRKAVSAAEAAEAERRLLDATFNAVPASIMVAGGQGRILRMNWRSATTAAALQQAAWKGFLNCSSRIGPVACTGTPAWGSAWR